MLSFSKGLPYIILLTPLIWGILSYAIFSTLRPLLPITLFSSVPVWICLWLFQMTAFCPFLIWILKQNYELDQKQQINMLRFQIPLGKSQSYLTLAYLAAVSAIPLYDTWYAKWLVFGCIVSPIFEELFSRNLLTPWLKKTWASFLSASMVSSAAFALMHWGFNSGEAFALTPQQQLLKFLSHFIFAMIFCLIFKFTKNIRFLILLHIAWNLKFILSKL